MTPPDVEIAAPAVVESAPIVVSAKNAAVLEGDFGSFRAANAAVAQGKPLEDVELDAKDAVKAGLGTPEAPRLNRRERQQQRINDTIREATEARLETARLRDELAKRDAAVQTRQPDASTLRVADPPAAPVATIPEHERILALPGAPQLEDFPSVQAYTAAMSVFTAKTLAGEAEQRAEQTRSREAYGKSQEERFKGFTSRLDQAKADDPEFVSKLTDDVKSLHGVAKGHELREQIGPRHIITEKLYDSPIVDRLLVHFSQQPDALKALETMPPAIAAIPDAHQRASAHIQHIVYELAKLEGRLEGTPVSASSAIEDLPSRPAADPTRIISAAPPPAPILSKPGSTVDATASAIKRGDFRAFRAIRAAERQADRSA